MNQLIKNWRRSQGLTQLEAAAKAGVTQGNWCKWEKGTIGIPAERCPSLHKLTGIPLHKLRPDIYPAPARV